MKKPISTQKYGMFASPTAADKIIRNAPLFPYLSAAMLAFFACAKIEFLGESPRVAAALAAVSAAAAATLKICEKPKPAKIGAIIFAFFLAAAYFGFRNPPNPYPNFAAREIRLELKADTVSITQRGAACGYAKIIGSPEFFGLAKSVYFYIKNPPESLFKGDEFSANFIVRPLDLNESFDAHLKNTGTFFKAYANDADSVRRGKLGELLFAKTRGFISKKLAALPPETSAADKEASNAFRAMILGDKSLIKKGLKTRLSEIGAMHIFAVSGLHVGIVAGAMFAALGLAGAPRKIQPFVGLPVLLLYVCACALPPSAVRAFIMAAFLWCAYALNRGSKSFSALCLSAAATLIISPADIFNAGFQLSYAVVAAIILWGAGFSKFLNEKIDSLKGFAPPDKSFASRLKSRARRAIVAAFAVSAAALIASAPITSECFGIIPVLSVIVSPIYVLGAGAAVCLGAASAAMPLGVSQYLNLAGSKICAALIWGAETLSQGGFVARVKIEPHCAFLIECALIAGLIFMPKISGGKKFLLPPLTAILGILLSAL